jgi:hypothetical protein
LLFIPRYQLPIGSFIRSLLMAVSIKDQCGGIIFIGECPAFLHGYAQGFKVILA